MDTDNYSHKNHKCWIVSQELTYLTVLFFKDSNAGGAVISLGRLIALQCFHCLYNVQPKCLTIQLMP